MKKLIACVLMLALCLTAFAACTETPADTSGSTDGTTASTGATEASTSGLSSAATYLYAMYRDDDGGTTMSNFSRVTVVKIGTVSYSVSWAIEVISGDESCVELTEDSDTSITVTIVNNKPTEEVQYKLVATLSDTDGNTEVVNFTHYIPATEVIEGAPVATQQDDLQTGVAYKLGMLQENLLEELYFAGTTANQDYYLTTTSDLTEAVDVYLEEVDGGYQMYFMADGVKTYIDVYYTDTGYVNIRLTETPTAVFTYNTEYHTMTTYIAEMDLEYYIGTYNTYSTLSASKLSYAATSFPSGLYTVETTTVTPTTVTAPETGIAYKLSTDQENLGTTLYFVGTTANTEYYLSTTEDITEAVDVYVEEVDGGYQMYFMADGVKTYIDVYYTDTGCVNIRLTETPTAVFTWSTEYNTFVTYIAEMDLEYYIGTYNTYNTLSCSKLSYAATSFPSHLTVLG